jgi:hypothetical protein
MSNVVAIVADQPTASAEPDVSFDTFWTLYPRHVAKKPAKGVWARLTAAQQLAAIVAVAEWRKVWLKRGEMEFIPHASTWLFQERWEDELPVAPTVSSASHVAFAPTTNEYKGKSVLPPNVLAAIKKITGAK